MTWLNKWRNIKMDDDKTKEDLKKKESAKIDAELETAKQEDHEHQLSAREFVPNVRIAKYKAGDFLCYDTHEIPVRFIESIEVGERGHAPYIGHTGMYGTYYVDKPMASIKVTKASGQFENIKCTRHELDILYDALTDVWKNYTNLPSK